MEYNSFINRKIFHDVREMVTETHEEQIKQILEVYNNTTIKNRLKNIRYFILYNVDTELTWVERLRVITQELNNDNSSDYALEVRYGKNNVETVRNKIKQNLGNSLENYIRKFGVLIGTEKYEKYCFSKYYSSKCQYRFRINKTWNGKYYYSRSKLDMWYRDREL